MGFDSPVPPSVSPRTWRARRSPVRAGLPEACMYRPATHWHHIMKPVAPQTLAASAMARIARP